MHGILSAPYRALAAVSRALPPFRGKWYAVRALHRILFPLLPRQAAHVRLPLAGGGQIRLDLRDLSEATHFWLGVYERHIAAVLRRAVRPDFVVINAGANIGASILETGREMKRGGGTIHAVEPVPDNLDRLRENVRENGLDGVVQIHSVALGRAEGTVPMWLRSRVTGADTGTAAVVEEGGGHIRVPMITLDTLGAGLSRCDLLLIDVDGSEFDLLAGAPVLLKRHRPAIIGEWDEYWLSRRQQRRGDVIGWAQLHGYTIHALRQDGVAEPVADTVGSEGDLLLLPAEWSAERRCAWTGDPVAP